MRHCQRRVLVSNKNYLLILIIIILVQNIVIKGFPSSIVAGPLSVNFFFKHPPIYWVECHQSSKEGSLGGTLSELFK